MQTIAPEILQQILSPEYNRRKVNQDYLLAYEQRLVKAAFSTDFVEQEMQRLANWFDLDAIANFTHHAYLRAYNHAVAQGQTPPSPPDFRYIDALPGELCPDGTPSHTKSQLILLANAYDTLLTAYRNECNITAEVNKQKQEMTDALTISRANCKDYKCERDEARAELKQLRLSEKQSLSPDTLLDAAQQWLNAHPREGEACRSLLSALLKGQRQEEIAALRYRSALTDDNDRLARQHSKLEALNAARERLYPLVANPEHVEEFLHGCLASEGNEELKSSAVKYIAKLNILTYDKIPQTDLVNLTLTLLHYTSGVSFSRIEALVSQRNK